MKLVTIKAFENSVEAHILKSHLESEGIACYIFDENMMTIYPLYNISVGGIKLKINEFDLEKAQELISEVDHTSPTDEEGHAIKCPNCQSEDLYTGFKSFRGIKGILSALLTFLFMIFPIYVGSVYRCKNCGSEFEK